MPKNHKLHLLSLSITVLTCLPLTVQAALPSRIANIGDNSIQIINSVLDKVTVNCQVDQPEKPVYSGQVMSTDIPSSVESNQLFEATINIKNTGNTVWMSQNSNCPGLSMTYLGTTRQNDRLSPFFAPAVFGDTSWYQGNRIIMKTARVEPGEVAEFKFIAHAPEQSGIYREYFRPVIDGITWINTPDAEATFDLKVGVPVEEEKVLGFSRELEYSLNLLDPQLFGEKKILVDLSEQKMQLKTGDMVIKTFTVSSGKAKTPTPVGKTKLLLKQQVRVAAGKPHYIMPKFMMFRGGGYGIHALPSLANDRGVFWREALNHIGSPRSHGCIRLLPKDAEFAFKFGEVGTAVEVVR